MLGQDNASGSATQSKRPPDGWPFACVLTNPTNTHARKQPSLVQGARPAIPGRALAAARSAPADRKRSRSPYSRMVRHARAGQCQRIIHAKQKAAHRVAFCLRPDGPNKHTRSQATILGAGRQPGHPWPGARSCAICPRQIASAAVRPTPAWFAMLGQDNASGSSTQSKRPPIGWPFALDKAPGSVLLSHGECHTTIGAGAFHFRVRDGVGWDHTAMAARESVRCAHECASSAWGRDVTSV